MIFAQIKNSLIQNTIELNNESLLHLFQNDPLTNDPYDIVLRIDEINPRPGIGYSYDGENFQSPPVEELPPEEE